MHETMVAQSIADAILEKARELGKRPVSARMSCGQFNAVNDEVMRFAFTEALSGTAAEGMSLEIVHYPLLSRCKSCNETFDFDVYNPRCRACGSEHFDFEPDHELVLESIEFQD